MGLFEEYEASLGNSQPSAKKSLWDEYQSQQPNKDQGGFLSSAAGVGGSLLKGTGQALKDVGVTGLGEAAIQKGADIEERNRPTVQSFSDIPEHPGKWISESAGQMAGQAGAALAGGLTGRAIGMGLGALTGPAAPVVSPILGAVGGYLGGNAPMLLQEYGSEREQQAQAGIDDKGRALAGAALTTGIENIGGFKPGGMAGAGKQVFSDIAGKSLKEGAKIVGKKMLKSGVEEGLEEIPQQYTGAWGGGQDVKDLATAQNLEQGLFGAAMAFPGGALFGGANTLADHYRSGGETKPIWETPSYTDIPNETTQQQTQSSPANPGVGLGGMPANPVQQQADVTPPTTGLGEAPQAEVKVSPMTGEPTPAPTGPLTAALDAGAIVQRATVPGLGIQQAIDQQYQDGGYNPMAGAWETPNGEQAAKQYQTDLAYFQAEQQALAQKEAELQAMEQNPDANPAMIKQYRKARAEIEQERRNKIEQFREGLGFSLVSNTSGDARNTQLGDQLSQLLYPTNAQDTQEPTQAKPQEQAPNPAQDVSPTESPVQSTPNQEVASNENQETQRQETHAQTSQEGLLNETTPSASTEGDFQPTHTIDGTPVRQIGEDLDQDAEGTEWEDTYQQATPLQGGDNAIHTGRSATETNQGTGDSTGEFTGRELPTDGGSADARRGFADNRPASDDGGLSGNGDNNNRFDRRALDETTNINVSQTETPASELPSLEDTASATGANDTQTPVVDASVQQTQAKAQKPTATILNAKNQEHYVQQQIKQYKKDHPNALPDVIKDYRNQVMASYETDYNNALANESFDYYASLPENKKLSQSFLVDSYNALRKDAGLDAYDPNAQPAPKTDSSVPGQTTPRVSAADVSQDANIESVVGRAAGQDQTVSNNQGVQVNKNITAFKRHYSTLDEKQRADLRKRISTGIQAKQKANEDRQHLTERLQAVEQIDQAHDEVKKLGFPSLQDVRKAAQDRRNRPWTKELYDQYHQAAVALVGANAQLAIDDSNTVRHENRVAGSVAILAKKLGLHKDQVVRATVASLGHDLGKKGMKAIIDKHEPLTPDEFGIIRSHPELTRQIMREMGLSEDVIKTASEHHETKTGGYPAHGAAPDFTSQVVQTADVADSLIGGKNSGHDYPLRFEGQELPRTVENVIRIMDSMAQKGELNTEVYDAYKAMLMKGEIPHAQKQELERNGDVPWVRVEHNKLLGKGNNSEPTKSEPKETEFHGVRIYPINIKGKDYYAVETEENKANRLAGDRNRGGDELYETLDQAKVAAQKQVEKASFKEFQQKLVDESNKQEQAKQSERANIDGFMDDANPMAKGRAISALNKEVNYKGKVTTIKELVRSKVKNGETTSTEEEDKIKPMSRIAYFRADNKRQAEHDKKVKEGGKVTVYYVGNTNLGKTAYDYANHLIVKQQSSNSQENPSENQTNSETTAKETKKTKAEQPGSGNGKQEGKAVEAMSMAEYGHSLGLTEEEIDDALIGKRVTVKTPYLDLINELKGVIEQHKNELKKPLTGNASKQYAYQDKIRYWNSMLDTVNAAAREFENPFSIKVETSKNYAKLAPSLKKSYGTLFDGVLTGDKARSEKYQAEAIEKRKLLDAYAENKKGQQAQGDKTTQSDNITPAEIKTPAIHIEGAGVERVTPNVVNNAMQKAAERKHTSKTQMREWLVGEIDKAILKANDYSEAEIAKELEEKAIARAKLALAAAKNYKPTPAELNKKADEYRGWETVAWIKNEYGQVTFDVPGDGRFKVLNTKEHLESFKQKVLASPGFRESRDAKGTRQPSQAQADSIKTAEKYIREGEYDFAAQVLSNAGIDVAALDDVLGKFKPEAANAVRQAMASNQEPQPAPSEVKAEETKPAPDNLLDAHTELWRRVHAGEVSADELRSSFEALVESEAVVKAELSKFTKEQLARRIRSYIRPDAKKQDLVDDAYESMITDYWISDDTFSYSYGFGSKETVAQIKAKKVRQFLSTLTDKAIEKYVAEIKDAVEARAKERAEMIEGLKDPKTLDDFQRLLKIKTGEGMSYQDARMSLTVEQREAFDTLAAAATRSQRQARADQQKDVKATVQTTTGDIVETKHTKTGEDLFVVKAAERVERDTYNQWNATAKRLGGWYSSFRGSGAVPGFQFKTRENAEAFLKYLGGDVEQAKQVAKERRDAYADDKSQTAVERLNEMADRLEEKADESLSQDRKTNTARRAGMADRAEAAARSDKAMAQTMRNIAHAIESGAVQFLDRVRQKIQVEMLQGFVSAAQYDKIRKQDDGKGRQPDYNNKNYDAETADYAQFPSYTAFRSDLASLGRQLLEIDGTKKLGQQLMSVADDVTDAYLGWAKENLHKVSTFRTQDGTVASFKSKADAEASISRSGFKGKAIVLPVKRGDNVIILSPSEAMKRGLWKGDNDKRITLSSEFGAELVEKLGKANRRGSKVNIPWQFETAYDKQKRLNAMGIATPAELRAALREFIGLREAPKEADKIKEMERAMIGRANDGLDFFPTPAGTADQMIEAADIQEGMSVLEPSAGMGHIADRIRETGNEPDVVELSNKRRELLEAKGFNVVGQDFMEVAGQYDRIIMNPPFGDRRDAEHVMHAYDLLKPGGRLVTIMGEGVFFGNDKKAQAFRDWLEERGGTDEKLEEGTFKDPSLPVQTSVNARMVVIDKPESDVKFSRTQSTKEAYEKRIGELFKSEKPIGAIKVLDKSDILDMLGYRGEPLYLNEKKVIDSRFNHQLTAEHWKKIPEWLDDPALVFDSFTVKGRLVAVAPETIDGKPVYIILDPNFKLNRLTVQLLFNAYEDKNKKHPFEKWVGEGLLRFEDDNKVSSLRTREGLQLPNLVHAKNRLGFKILHRSDLVKYRNANQAKHSTGSQNTTGSTVTQVKSWLSRQQRALMQAGVLKVAQSAQEAIDSGALPFNAGNGIEGFYNPKTDELWVIADNVNQDNIQSVLAHELLHRAEAKDPKVKAAMERFESDVKRRFQKAAQGLGTPIEREAYARVVNANTPVKDQLEEFRAYLVSAYAKNPNSIIGVLRKAFNDFVAAIRAFLVRNGLDGGFIKSLSAADLMAMSKYGAKVASSKTELTTNGIKASTKPAIEKTVSWSKDRIDRLMRQYAYTMDDNKTKAFSTWLSPSDFLAATTTKEYRQALENEREPLRENDLKSDEPIRLYVKETSEEGVYQITGHEGRHRMMALRDAGVERVPVVLVLDRPLGNAQSVEEPYFKAQIHDGVKSERGFDSNYMTPISWAYKSELDSNFGRDADIRYSIASPQEIFDSLNEIKQTAPDKALTALSKAMGKAKELGLGALTQNQLVEIGSKILPVLKDFANAVNQYNVTEARYHKQADGIAERWAKLPKATMMAISDMMHDMTVMEVDPRKPEPVLNKNGTNGIAIRQHQTLKARWDKLSPEAKTIINDAEKFHNDVQKALVQSITDKIEMSGMPAENKERLIRDLESKFKTQKGPYFPLMRFGRYWVSYEGGVEFFESEREQSQFRENSGKTIKGYGKSLQNFQQVEGVDVAFVEDVNGLIDKLDIEQAETLKDGIFQLYLTALPEQSMRKHFIHRKKTPGWERDALRSFAKKAFHDGKQLAKVQYTPDMRKVLNDAKEVIETGNSPDRTKALKRRIELITELLDQLDNGVDYADLSKEYQDDGDLAVIRRFSRYTDEMDREKALGDYLGEQEALLEQVERYQQHNSRESATDIVDALNESFEHMMKSNTSPLTNLINQSVFTFFLGFNPASAIVNGAQTPLVALPVIAGRHGFIKASRAMADAVSDFFSNRKDGEFNIQNNLKNKGERAMYDALVANGTFDRTRSHDLAGFAEEGAEHGTWRRTLMNASTYMFHHVEVANREITALAAYRMEYAKTGDVNKAIEYADNVVKGTHLDYSSNNRPVLFQGNAARVMLQFKMYSQGMTYLWGKQVYDAIAGDTKETKAQARKTVMALTGVQVAAAGVLGLPIGGVLMAAQALAGLGDDDDDPVDVEQEIRQALTAVFGPDISRMISRGVASETGIDFADRLSLQDLWIREPDKDVEGKDANYYLIKTLFGPLAGITENMLVGLKMMQDGNAERGLEKMLPNTLSSALKAARMASEGGATSLQGNMIYETNAYEKGLQALGFKPSGLAEQQIKNSALKNRESAILDTKSRLMGIAARAKMNGNAERYQDAMEDIAAFNERNPSMRITQKDVMESVKQRKASQRKSEDGIVINKKLNYIRAQEAY